MRSGILTLTINYPLYVFWTLDSLPSFEVRYKYFWSMDEKSILWFVKSNEKSFNDG